MLKVIEGPIINAGESLSEAVDCSEGQLVRITMPESWDESTPLTFQFSTDGMFFNEMCGLDGFAVTIKDVWAGSGVIIPSDIGRAIAHLKIRAGTFGNPVEQRDTQVFAVAILTEGVVSVEGMSGAEFQPIKKRRAPAKKKAAKKKR
jgi:hypothetical protein